MVSDFLKSCSVAMVIVVAGVWDVMSNEDVVEYVRIRIAQNMRPAEVRNGRSPGLEHWNYVCVRVCVRSAKLCWTAAWPRTVAWGVLAATT